MENIKYYPLSHPQQRIWYTEMILPGTSFANIACSVKLKKDIVNPNFLKKAINLAIKHNDALRIRIVPGDSTIQQYVTEYQEIDLETIQGTDLKEWLAKESQTPFNLASGNLFYFALLKYSEENYGYYMKLHHVISDGFSFSILNKQIVDYYELIEEGQPLAERPKPSFLEYFKREEEYSASPQYSQDREYWKKRLSNLPEPLNLQFSPAKSSITSIRRVFTVSQDLQNRIDQFCRQQETTLFRFMMAVLYVYLTRAYGNNDLIIGTAYYNRVGRKELNAIGMYVSTIPVRICADEKITFGELLALVHEQLTRDMAHQQYPYDLLTQDLRKEGQNTDGLLNINLVQIPNGKGDKYLIEVQHQGADPAILNMVINPNQLPKGASLEIALEYRKEVFSSADIERIFNHLLALIEDLLPNPDKKISQLEVMPEKEKKQILVDFNNTNLPVPNKTVVDLFREQAEKTPENIAVVDCQQRLTYTQLDRLTDSLAARLQDLGVATNSIVGILVPRTGDFVIGALAVMKAGGAYLPIHPEYPEARIGHMLSDSGTAILLSREEFRGKAPDFSGEFIDLGVPDSFSYPPTKLERTNQPSDLAYIIYTSGSTGTPKGVMITQNNLINLASWHNRHYQITEKDVSAAYSSFSFDVSVKQVFPFLLTGGSVHILPEELLLDLSGLNRYLEENKVTFVDLPTQLAEAFMENYDHKSLRYMTTGGDKLRTYTPRSYQLVNEYGPTEFTVSATYFTVDRQYNNIPIGKPLGNSWAYVLDKNGVLQPIGVPGELCLAGKQIAKGYLNRPELTAEKFVPNPYTTCPENALMYKTGDLVRWLPDGDLEYLGRIDMQVKIRGYRIELGEIELAILNFPGITNTVVIDLLDSSGNKYLCAYLVTEEEIEIENLKHFLAKDLPDYMVPGVFMSITAIPYNASGKVDRRSLPVPDLSDSKNEYVAPRTDLEIRICRLWEEILGVERVGIKDDFFALGGTSIKGITLQTRLQQALGIQITVGEIFTHSTPESLVVLVEGTDKYLPIPAAPLADSYPLTPPQRQMYILRQTLAEETVYNMPNAFTIKGLLNREKMEAAFTTLIKRHSALRTYFVNIEGEPRQKIADKYSFHLIYQEAKEEAGEIIESYNQPFNLAEPLLFRAGLINVAQDEHILFFIAHHIILDGLSMDILVSELLALYNHQKLPPLRIGYHDFALWQQGRETFLAGQENYWLDQFSDQVPALELVTDYPRPPVMSHQGAVVTGKIDMELTQGLRRVAKENKTTLFTVLLAGYMVFLARYAGKEDLVVGVPFAGRVHPDLENTVGMFVCTLPLRSKPEYQKSFRTLLGEMKEQMTKAQENQDYPLENLVRKLGIRPDPSRNPLFDVLFNFLPSIGWEENGDLQITPYDHGERKAHFDLVLNIQEAQGFLEVQFTYCTKLFHPTSIEGMLNHYLVLLSTLVESSDVSLKNLSLLANEEREILLGKFNDNYLPVPRDKTYLDLFREQAAKTPENIALMDYHRSLTYAELDKSTDSLGARLQDLGIGPDTIVGIMVPRTADFVIGSLAIMKAGGAYLPISADYPEGRIQHLITDSKITVLLGVEQSKERAVGFNGTFINLGDPDLYNYPVERLAKVNKPSDLAYIIYTSGSTGKPKGVMISHINLINLCVWHNHQYQIAAEDISALYFNPSFDASVKQIFPFLIQGGGVLIIPEDLLLDISRLNQHLLEKKVTFLGLPTQFAETFMESCTNSILKYVIVGGEKLRSYKPQSYQLVNEYGPTEFTVCSTYYPVKEELDNIPIGKPVANSWAYVLDKKEDLQPTGVPGELCLAGIQIARGYLYRPELTAEKFVPNPYTTCPENALMYKTGDLVRWLPDGNLEYLGRIDMQVKIRGYRIELGEIESAILNFPGITSTVVVDLPDPSGNKYLSAYLVAEEAIELENLKHFLAQDLPSYMIPSVFILIPFIPVTPNGKVDRKALPEPDVAASQTEYVAPVTDVQTTICQLWEKILGVERVGIKDDFFALGGTSIKGITLQTKLQQSLGSQITVGDIFSHPTPEALAVLLEGTDQYLPIPVAHLADSYPLTPPQRQMYILRQTLAEETVYNIPAVFTVKGLLDKERLEDTFISLIKRHAALRTYFINMGGEPRQKIADKFNFQLVYQEAERDQVVGIIASYNQPFNLAEPLLFRAGIITVDQDEHVLFFVAHHIILDGLSIDVLVADLLALYGGKDLPPVKIGYPDFALWQQERLTESVLANQEKYWLGQFADEVPALELLTDYPRPPVMSHAGAVIAETIDKELTQGLRRLAKENKTTLFTVLLTGYMALLARYSGKEDLVVGVPFAGRIHPDVESTVGMFVNTLALRSKPEYQKSFKNLLREVKEQVTKAQENQDYPLESLVQKLGIRPDPSRNPLFDVVFNFLTKIENTGDLAIEEYPGKTDISHFDLSLTLEERPENLRASITYCTKLYCPETMTRMLKHYLALLALAVENPDLSLKDFSLLSKEESRTLLKDFNDTYLPVPSKTIVDLFREQANRTPGNIALAFNQREITYAQLDRLTDLLAKHLTLMGAGREKAVAILVERSAEMVIAALGVLKSGAAYLPLDPTHPAERLQFMLGDAEAVTLITQENLKNLVGDFKGGFLDIAKVKELEDLADISLTPPKPENLFILLYTSGSTGKPKGVMLEHRSIVNFCFWYRQYYGVTESDISAAYASFGFDASMMDVYPFLISGARVHIIPEEMRLNLSQLNDYFEENGITLTFMTTQLGRQFVENYDNKSLRILSVGGERFQSCRLPKHGFVNGYGPTECTIFTTTFTIDQDYSNMPIGKPLANIWIYILDPYGNLQPLGVAGELCIAGVQVARGYLNQPELTKEKFVPNPYTTCPENARMYRTGDLARWLPDGNIEYINRMDQQVKIRGFRIELGEIEQNILKYPGVTDGVVVDLLDTTGNKYLCAYFTASETIQTENLKQFIAKDLPYYMVPSVFMQIEALPVNQNGKVNRRALPKPDFSTSQIEYVAPQNEMEEKMAAIWQEVLGVERVGLYDDFFDLGGHSLKVSVLINKVKKSFNVDIAYQDAFNTPVLKKFVTLVTKAEKLSLPPIEKNEKLPVYPLLAPQKKMLDFALKYAGNSPLPLEIKGKLDVNRLWQAWETLVERHETLRTAIEFVDGDPVQSVADQIVVERTVSQVASQDLEKAFQEFIQPFKLNQAPLWRAELWEVEPDRYIFMLDIHHIVIDGSSMGVLMRELALSYEGKALPFLEIQYRDYAVWQDRLLKSGGFKKMEDYWLENLAGAQSFLELPTDLPRQGIPNYVGEDVDYHLSPELTQKVTDFALQAKSTPHVVIMAVYAILLAKYSGKKDIIFEEGIAGRNYPEVENLIGMFVNVIPMRSLPENQKSFRKFVAEVNQTLIKGYECQEYPMAKLAQKLNLKVDPDLGSLQFDIGFVYQSMDIPQLQTTDWEMKVYPLSLNKGVARRELLLVVNEDGNKIALKFVYRANLFHKFTIERMAEDFGKILANALANPDEKLERYYSPLNI